MYIQVKNAQLLFYMNFYKVLRLLGFAECDLKIYIRRLPELFSFYNAIKIINHTDIFNTSRSIFHVLEIKICVEN